MHVNLELQEAWNVVLLSQVFFCQVKTFKNLLLTLFWINSFQWSEFVAGCQVTAVSLLLSLWNKSCELLSLNDFIGWIRRYLPAGSSSGWCLPILICREWLIYLHLIWINQFGFFALSTTDVICCCCYVTWFCCLFWGTRQGQLVVCLLLKLFFPSWNNGVILDFCTFKENKITVNK